MGKIKWESSTNWSTCCLEIHCSLERTRKYYSEPCRHCFTQAGLKGGSQLVPVLAFSPRALARGVRLRSCLVLMVLAPGTRCPTWKWKPKHPKTEECSRALGNLSHHHEKSHSWHLGITSNQVLILLHPLSTKCSRSGLHSLSLGSIISTTLSLQNLRSYPVLSHHRRTQSEIVKCINKPVDKSSHGVFVNLSLISRAAAFRVFRVR